MQVGAFVLSIVVVLGSAGLGDVPNSTPSWHDFRGPHRDGTTTSLPDSLPEQPPVLWRYPMTGLSMGGICATQREVIYSDKDVTGNNDIIRCLEAATGKLRWEVSLPAQGELDFGNSMRATPVIDGINVYLLNAFGELLCVDLFTGLEHWRVHLVNDLGGKLPTWGYSSTPLIVGDKLIVNPGGPGAAWTALRKTDGSVIWQTPGEPAAYASPILAKLGGVEQIVGFDISGVAGYRVDTGERLWRVQPKINGDFNVPTPCVWNGKLILNSENNATRMHAFNDDGTIMPDPVAINEDLYPETPSSVIIGNRLFGVSSGVVCLDLEHGLKTVAVVEDEAFADHASLFADDKRLLIFNTKCELFLIDTDEQKPKIQQRVKLFPDAEELEIWNHPAFVAGRFYAQGDRELVCFDLTPQE